MWDSRRNRRHGEASTKVAASPTTVLPRGALSLPIPICVLPSCLARPRCRRYRSMCVSKRRVMAGTVTSVRHDWTVVPVSPMPWSSPPAVHVSFNGCTRFHFGEFVLPQCVIAKTYICSQYSVGAAQLPCVGRAMVVGSIDQQA